MTNDQQLTPKIGFMLTPEQVEVLRRKKIDLVSYLRSAFAAEPLAVDPDHFLLEK